MTFINIGEKIKLLSTELRAANSIVPWKGISAFRDVVAHGYDTLRMDDIWGNIKELLPDFLNRIEKIINDDA